MLTLVAQEAEHMILLGENLLNADAIGRGVLRLRLERSDPLETLNFVAGKHRRSAALKGIGINVLTPDSKASVYADRTVLVQILDNLVSNAVKYTPPGGSIFLSVELVPGYPRVKLAVVDNGPGLSHEDQKKVFAEFATLSARPTGREHSVGLGLSIVKRMAECMDGEAGYEPNPSIAGARFYVVLPA